MTTLEDIYDKAKTVAEVAGKKTGELVELTRLKLNAADLEKKISVLFEKLGQLVYEEPENAAAIEEEKAKITALKQDLAELRETIATLKNGVLCASCDTVNEKDAAYCKSCGTQL